MSPQHNRRSIRLPGYDYSRPGAYFVTTVTQNRASVFGEVSNGTMVLNEAGRIIEAAWHDLPNHYSRIRLDAFVVMPNHAHGIVIITADPAVAAESVLADSDPAPTDSDPASVQAEHDPVRADSFVRADSHSASVQAEHDPVRAGLRPAPTAPTTPAPLSEIIRAFKSFSARRINEWRGTPGVPVWQRNYYEHIVRTEASLNRIRAYILNNPLKWERDRENPALPEPAR